MLLWRVRRATTEWMVSAQSEVGVAPLSYFEKCIVVRPGCDFSAALLCQYLHSSWSSSRKTTRTDGPPVGEREKGPKGGSIYSPETPYSFTITKQMYCRYSTVRAPLEKQTERKRLEMDDGLVLASRQGLSSSSVGPTVRPGGQNKSRRRRMLQAKRRTTMSLRQNDGRSVVWRQGRKSLLSLPAFLEVDKFLVRQL